MVKFFLKIYDYLQNKRRLCMSLIAVFTALLLVMTATLKYNENIYDFLPMSGNEQKALTLYQDISGGQSVIAMFSMADGESASNDLLTTAVDTFEQRLQIGEGRKHISQVTTQIDYDKVIGVTDFVYQNIPLMLTDSDYVRMERLLATPGYASSQLAEDIQSIMMPATGFFSSSISRDPLALFKPVIDRMQSKQGSMPFEMDDGYIFTSGGKYAIAMLSSPYGATESSNNGLLVEYIDSIREQTQQAVPKVKVEVTGSPVIAVGNARQIKSDSQLAIFISVTLIIGLLAFSFRKIRSHLLIAFSIIFGWLFAMGFISLVRSDVSLIVIGIGSIIIGIAVNYPLHFIAHTDHGGTTRDVLKDMVSPLLIGNFTTVGAFASLMPLNAPALRDLGLFAAFMLIGTILFVLIFLPHLVKQRSQTEEERLPFGKISSASPENHRWVIWLIFVLTFIFGYYSLNTSFDANMHNINYMTDDQKTLLANLNASAGLNDTTNVYVVSEGKTWDEALANRQKLSKTLEGMKDSNMITGYTDVSTFVCSQEEQIRRIALWNEFWQKHEEEVRSQLSVAAPEYGFSADAFDDFYNILSASYEPQPFEHFEPMRDILLKRSFSTFTGQCSVVDVVDASDKDVSQIEASLSEAVGSKGYVFDFMGMNSAVANSLSDDFNYIGFACGFIVFVFLWISFGRLELSLLSFLPMAIGWLWILGSMYLFGMKFNIVNVILATFIFGQGDDYTIFMTDGLINEFAYRRKLLASYKNSIVISAIIMFIGMGSLIVARHPALHSLAEVTIVGMFTVVLMAWIVPPIVFGWLVRRKGQTRRVPITIEQIVRTSYCALVYFIELLIGCIVGLLAKLIPIKSIENLHHKIIQKCMYFDAHHIYGVKCNIHNEHHEDFSHPSIIICNHQSMLDPMYILALNPRIVVVVGDNVWRNPLVNLMFRLSGFINVNQSIDSLKKKVGEALACGYNVAIFPEGMRSDEGIVRFHKGAFFLAEELGADIVPLYLHGTGHVMPKGSALAARGSIDIEIGKRIQPSDLPSFGETQQLMAHGFRRMYKEHYFDMMQRLETSHYFHDYVIYKYTFKGIGIERNTRSLLRKYDDFSSTIDHYTPSIPDSNVVSIINAGEGQFSLLFALVHPECEIHSYTYDQDEADLASSIDPQPVNLHVHLVADEAGAREEAAGTNIIPFPSTEDR